MMRSKFHLVGSGVLAALLAPACAGSSPGGGSPSLGPDHHIAQESEPKRSSAAERYPNELPTLLLFESQAWSKLVPLETRAEEILAILGEPAQRHDLDNYTAPYAGDAQAKMPVWTYEHRPGWQLLVYLGRSDFSNRRDLRPEFFHRLYSLELIPSEVVKLKLSDFPSTFSARNTSAADASWTEYSSANGLAYHVYSRGPKKDQLARVVYGPRVEERTRAAVTP